MYREDEDSPVMPRRNKRAYSECHQPEATGENRARASSLVSIIRTQSDSDLRNIDRKRTFEHITTVEPNDLLAKVASALGQLRPPDDDDGHQMQGVQGFSDSQILASERTWGGWSSAARNGLPPAHRRLRAVSETKLPYDMSSNDNAYEWTWSGANNQINDLRTLRQRSRNNDLYRASFGEGGGSTAADDNQRRQSESQSTIIPIPPSAETTINAGQNRFLGRFNNFFRRRAMSTSSGMMQELPSNIHEDAIKYLRATSDAYPSKYLNANTYAGGSGGGGAVPAYSRRGSIYESLQNDNSAILENTTIADLIKVLEEVHTQAALKQEGPKRKLGNASLTPPEMPSVYGLFDPTPDRKPFETYNSRLRDRRGSMFPSLGPFPTSSRRASLMPMSSSSSDNKHQPPPYSSLDAPPAPGKNTKRRFSVRPTALSSLSQNSSSNISLASNSSASQVPPVTRRMSLRPSPLARDPMTSGSFRDSSKFAKPKSLQREAINQNARQRHGSLSNLPERPLEKKRFDSK